MNKSIFLANSYGKLNLIYDICLLLDLFRYACELVV